MPFSFFRPDGLPRRPGSNGSFSSFFSASYSTNYTRQPSERGFAAPRPAANNPSAPPLNRIPSRTSVAYDEQELPSIVNLRTGGTPPRLTFLPTPPGSAIRPVRKEQERLKDDDENSSFYSTAKVKAPNPALHDLTPETLQLVRESRESPWILSVSAADFAEWEARYPGIDESSAARYEYDGYMERMIIKCMAGPVHDSFPIYFFRAINEGLNQAGPQCRRGLQMCTSTDFYNFKGQYEDTHTRKSPDAYIKVAGVRGFPSVVVEVGWAESMENLTEDARLWLLGTARQTKVVIVVKFTESSRNDVSSSSHSSKIDADDAEGDDIPESTEESLLIATVNDTTRFSFLAQALLDLHLRGVLAKPLLGNITATFHAFRSNPNNTVYEDFTTTVLPAPDSEAANNQPQTYGLTLADLYGDTPVPAGEDPHQKFIMDMDDFRRDIAYQVPEMEVKRSLDRAETIMKMKGVWENKVTFAGAKKAKRKRGEEGDSQAGYQEKRAK